MKPKMVRKIFWCLLGIGFVIGSIGAYHSKDLAAMGIILMICAVLFHLIFYRCPHCGRFFDRSNGEFCPHCGKKIDD